MSMLCLHATTSDCLCYSNRTSRDDTLIFGSTPAECMSVWEAARCTSAAPHYFKPLIWQGKLLLDGALKLICPAARANSEAESIWPDKRCDILLSLETGTSPNLPPKHNNVVTEGKAVGDIIDASRAWAKFCRGHPQRHTLFRLNPSYHNEFTVDDVKKLNEIQTQTEEWILKKDEEVNYICDQLIAALFYFRPTDDIGVLAGTIFCRLPPTMGQKFIRDIRQKANLNSDLPLFAVKHHGITLDVDIALRNTPPSDELCFELTCHGVPTTGDTKIDVKMRGMLQTRYPWFPISGPGSPYNILQKLHRPETLAKVRKPCYINPSFDRRLKDGCAVKVHFPIGVTRDQQ